MRARRCAHMPTAAGEVMVMRRLENVGCGACYRAAARGDGTRSVAEQARVSVRAEPALAAFGPYERDGTVARRDVHRRAGLHDDEAVRMRALRVHGDLA